jgi:hypothetical protein
VQTAVAKASQESLVLGDRDKLRLGQAFHFAWSEVKKNRKEVLISLGINTLEEKQNIFLVSVVLNEHSV